LGGIKERLDPSVQT